MSATIITSRAMLRGGTEQLATLRNRSLVRRLNFGTGWNQLRIGITFHFGYFYIDANYRNLLATPRFALGLCSGITAPFRDGSTTHFVGAVTNNVTWFANGGTYWGVPAFVGAVKVGTTLTLGAELAGGSLGMEARALLDPSYGTPALFLDIIKGSPNFTIKAFYSINGSADCTAAQFLTQMMTDPPNLTNHTYNAVGVTMAVDEATNGALDSVNVAWNRPSPLVEIADWGFRKVS